MKKTWNTIFKWEEFWLRKIVKGKFGYCLLLSWTIVNIFIRIIAENGLKITEANKSMELCSREHIKTRKEKNKFSDETKSTKLEWRKICKWRAEGEGRESIGSQFWQFMPLCSVKGKIIQRWTPNEIEYCKKMLGSLPLSKPTTSGYAWSQIDSWLLLNDYIIVMIQGKSANWGYLGRYEGKFQSLCNCIIKQNLKNKFKNCFLKKICFMFLSVTSPPPILQQLFSL